MKKKFKIEMPILVKVTEICTYEVEADTLEQAKQMVIDDPLSHKRTPQIDFIDFVTGCDEEIIELKTDKMLVWEISDNQ